VKSESQVRKSGYEAFRALANWVRSANSDLRIPLVSYRCPVPADGQVVRQVVPYTDANSVVHDSARFLSCPLVTPLKTGVSGMGS